MIAASRTDAPAKIDRPRLTVVVSKGQSRHPEKRGLENAVVQLATAVEGVDVLEIPHLYDLTKDGPALTQLRSIPGDLMVVSWIFSRAARWVLDRGGVRGSELDTADDIDGEDDDPDASSSDGDANQVVGEDSDQTDSPVRVSELFPRPSRRIHCVELSGVASADAVIERVHHFVGQQNDETKIDVAGDASGILPLPIIGGQLRQVDETTSRRWYPVIDFDRCTNCMECVDFCLFGVYGLDDAETILVEQPDNCRKGCPACSRVCPENAIIFPQHKAPAIAGAEVEGGEGFKIDLSQLFGAPADDDPIATAARERDEQLLLTGRDAVGIDETLAKRQSQRQSEPKDELDALIDQLDALDV